MKHDTSDRFLAILLDSGRDKHIAALKVIEELLDEAGLAAEKDCILERLLLAFHREMQSRQFAESRGEYSLTRVPDASKPPGLSYYPIGALLASSPHTMTAYQVIDLVAPKYRYRYRLRRRVQDDLARFSAYFGGLVWLQIFSGRAPVPTFEHESVMSWLAAGGRAWIIAELDKHSSGRVVQFRGRA